MTLLAIIALILGIVAGVWAVMDRSWQLLILAIAVVLLALSGEVNIRISD